MHYKLKICSVSTHQYRVLQVGHQALLEPLIRGDAMQDEVRHVLRAVTSEQRAAKMIHIWTDLHVTAGRE